MSVYLDVEMPDGSVWRVPAEPIAAARAAHYAGGDWEDGIRDYPTLDEAIAAEIAYTLSESAVLIDWAQNDMNWEDVATSAVQIRPARAADFQRGWTEGEMRVVRAEPSGATGAGA